MTKMNVQQIKSHLTDSLTPNQEVRIHRTELLKEIQEQFNDPLELIQDLYYNQLTPETRQSFLQELQGGKTKVRITESEIRWGNSQ